MSWEDTEGKTCELVSNTTALKTKGYGSTKKDMISFTLGTKESFTKKCNTWSRQIKYAPD